MLTIFFQRSPTDPEFISLHHSSSHKPKAYQKKSFARACIPGFKEAFPSTILHEKGILSVTPAPMEEANAYFHIHDKSHASLQIWDSPKHNRSGIPQTITIAYPKRIARYAGYLKVAVLSTGDSPKLFARYELAREYDFHRGSAYTRSLIFTETPARSIYEDFFNRLYIKEPGKASFPFSFM